MSSKIPTNTDPSDYVARVVQILRLKMENVNDKLIHYNMYYIIKNLDVDIKLNVFKYFQNSIVSTDKYDLYILLLMIIHIIFDISFYKSHLSHKIKDDLNINIVIRKLKSISNNDPNFDNYIELTINDIVKKAFSENIISGFINSYYFLVDDNNYTTIDELSCQEYEEYKNRFKNNIIELASYICDVYLNTLYFFKSLYSSAKYLDIILSVINDEIIDIYYYVLNTRDNVSVRHIFDDVLNVEIPINDNSNKLSSSKYIDYFVYKELEIRCKGEDSYNYYK